MEQGGGGAADFNRQPFAYDPSSVNYLFVTHAHIDHIGRIPKLVKDGFKGEIYSTPETREIAALLLLDAVKIGLDSEPLYGLEDVSNAMAIWKTIPYHTPQPFDGFTLELYNAGHVLGSSMLQFTFQSGKKMLFTGDIGNSPSPLLSDVERVGDLDYLLMESVYGDRNHEDRERRVARFNEVVSQSIKRGGALLIPAFSLERTQEILMLLDQMFEEEKKPSAPVYLDSPLAQKITPIFERALGPDKFNFRELVKIARVADSRAIAQIPGAKIIVAGSGMSTAGRIIAHEKHFLPDSNSTILLMGYQAAGTLGRQIAEGVKKVMIDEEPVTIKARVEKIDGFSGHADSNALVDLVSHTASTIKQVFVAMGEQRSQIFLAQRLRDELGVEAIATEVGRSYEMDL